MQFLVQSDGELEKINVIKGIGSGCDKEAVRVVQSMPLWKPGTKDGVEIPAIFTLRIRFQLED